MGSARTAPVDDQGRFAASSSKKRATGIRAWLVIDSSGQTKMDEFGKHLIMRRTGVPARDLRILDPFLSYPSRILARDRAIVVNLEHIKAIITATEVLLLNSRDPLVAPFVRDLQSRISNLHCYSPPPGETESVGANMNLIDKDALCSVRTDAEPTLTSLPRAGNSRRSQFPYRKACGDLGSMILPFEFRVLEVCLEFLCRCLESETSTLEQEAYPVLDELTSKISMLNLERVRQIKSRLVSISGRVQKVRDELEHLLDDDAHMAEMYLTNKPIHQEETFSNDYLENDEHSRDNERDQDASSINGKMRNTNEISNATKLPIEDLEMLLEAYFIQTDGTLNKLSMLREYVDDTEDYINIMLDDKQNQLLHTSVIINIAILLITAAVVVTGIFGMNIHISLFETSMKEFLETTVGTLGGTLALYFITLGWARKSFC